LFGDDELGQFFEGSFAGVDPLNDSTKRNPVVPASFVAEELARRFGGTTASTCLARQSALPKLLDEAYALNESESFLDRVGERFGLTRRRKGEDRLVGSC
jgi:hypothetical protein